MTYKKTILHLIDSLGTGGAETLLVNANVRLPEFRHVVVYLREPNVHASCLKDIEVICLGFRHWLSLPGAVFRLRKLIRKHQVCMVHSHLYYSTIIARLACPSHVALVSSYHSLLYDPKNKAQYSPRLLMLDRLTYRRRYHHLYVSKAVQKLLREKLGNHTNHEVLYNYVDDNYFSGEIKTNKLQPAMLRIVMLGNLRPEKNYPLVIRALADMPKRNFTLDIYGEGVQRTMIEEMIKEYQLTDHIQLKGRNVYPHQVLPAYDLYIAASRFEGFGIALAEAMATGLPCLVSDIAAHQEVASEAVKYFNSDDARDLTKKLQELLDNPVKLNAMKMLSRQRAEKFRKDIYMVTLAQVYNKCLNR